MSQAEPARVFISYSWDDKSHKDRVLELAQRLRRDGIDAWIDQFTPFAAQGWVSWMQDEIACARFVLCVVTRSYADRFCGRTSPGVGRGVKWEGSIVTDAIYQADGNNTKFIPIFFDEADATKTPFPLNKHVDLGYVLPGGYDAIYRLLTGQPITVPADVGPSRQIPLEPTGPALAQPKVYRHRSNRGNLPRLPYFFGREEQLQNIERALQPTARTWIVLIDGPGGIGKTTLAIRAAGMASEDDYPRIVFASAKVRELEPGGVRAVHDFLIDSYLDLLNSVGRELGDDGLAKLDEKERPEALCRLLRQKPALLVLDNLETLRKDDLERLLEFLKHLPQGTKAIVTSRRRTDVQAEIIRLDRMNWPAAKELLAELARHSFLLGRADDDKRRALYENTGGNPLILRWVVGQLGRGRCRTVEGALKLLKDSPEGAAALEFIFEDLVDTFTPEETSLLAALTYFTQPVAVGHIAELSGLAPLAAEPALDGLADRALVIGDAELRHFVLTPLVADFLRRAKPEVVRESGDRLAKRAYALAVENGYEKHDRFPILKEAWPMIAAALPVLFAGENDRLQTVCDALTAFLDFMGRWDERIILDRLAEDKAVALGDYRKAGWRACQSADMLFHRGNAEEVLAAADRAFDHYQKAPPDPHELGIAFRRRGMGYELQKDYPAALAAYGQTLDLWRKSSMESEDVARVLNDIARIKRRTKDYVAAERDYREALRIARQIGKLEAVGVYMGNLAGLALEQELWSQVEILAREALNLSEKVGRREQIAWNCRRIATALARQGRPSEVLPFACRALEIFTEIRSPESVKAEETLRQCGATLRNFAITCVEQGRFEEAEKLFLESLTSWRKLSDRVCEGSVLNSLAWAYREMGEQIEKAQESHELALLAARDCGDWQNEGRALYGLGLLFQDQALHQEAEIKFRESLAIWRENRQFSEEAKTLNSLGWICQRQQRWTEAENCYQDASTICKEINDPVELHRTEDNLAKLKVERTTVVADPGTLVTVSSRSLHSPDQSPFESEVYAYEQADQLRPPPKVPILFYGSSSIRFWPMLEEDDFLNYDVLNRAFGGARLQSCVRLFDRLVKPYSPRAIILYAGDNDLADGHSPEHILDSLREFLLLVAKSLPATVVAYISIKPSPVRLGYRDQIEATNRLIEDFALNEGKQANLTYLNIYNKMLGPNGSFREDLFLDDGLHMNTAGFAIWTEVVASYLSAIGKQAVVSNPRAGRSGVKREYYKGLSSYLGREMEMLVFGHAGIRTLVFPTLRGRFYQYEDHGMVEALADRLKNGTLQLYCVDGIDLDTLYNRSLQPHERISRQMDFEKYILHEVLPFSESMNRNSFVIAHGCSLGAFHAVNIALRHPHLIHRVVALSGRYDLTRSFGHGFRELFDDYYDDDIYFNTPSQFIPNLTDPQLLQQLRKLDITLAIGEWDPFIENNCAFSKALWDKGIWHAFHVWREVAHDFHHWREMVRLYT